MLKTRVITVLLLLPPFLAALFYLPVQGWALLALLVTAYAAKEWARLAQMRRSAELLFVIAVIACCSVLVPVLRLFDKAPADDLSLAIYAVSLAFWLLAAPLWLIYKWRLNKSWLALSGLLVLVTAWLALVQLREIAALLILWLLSVVWVADTAAYFCGRKFGKRKLAPEISPGKTLEGIYGAFFAVSAYAIVIILFSGNHNVSALSGKVIPGYLLLAAHWFIAGLSIVGDLFESLFKRQAGVKDSGTILPGHGGVLDRIDGLISTLPVMAFFIFYST
ncbi:MAG TPA: phosphatidate cytidylyltransferase [Burkholderiales bacterium]|nr:phosphatidate cytidylyltransferase [Burkholderiales bacterium]